LLAGHEVLRSDGPRAHEFLGPFVLVIHLVEIGLGHPDLGVAHQQGGLPDFQVGIRLAAIQLEQEVADFHRLADADTDLGDGTCQLRADGNVAGAAGLGGRLDHADTGHRVAERGQRRWDGRERFRLRPLDEKRVRYGKHQQSHRQQRKKVFVNHG